MDACHHLCVAGICAPHMDHALKAIPRDCRSRSGAVTQWKPIRIASHR